ncbi:AsmA family protein [Phreatobacter aquaticus]|uniref:AsmA family protein n=1 Tax=Phreatobacter aquaticus TaxID=2570229 RepID=A0A4D7QPG1_9HYPH|nr:AsmA family protein [Phreatobacter aquaticus]QCK86042.1 AsmA family protein [Phreatobacter aquaticus]
MQNSLLAIGFAIIAAIVAALVGPWLINWNNHKAYVEAEAGRILGQPVSISGDLSIRLLPSITVDARDVTIGAPGHPTRIGRLHGELRVAPLLRGEAALTALHLRDADITWTGGAGIGRLLLAENIIIENGRLSALDATGTPWLIGERMMLTGESRGSRGPVRLEGRMAADGRTVAVQTLASLPEQGGLSLRVRAQDQDQGLTLEAEGTITGTGGPRFEGPLILSGATGGLPWRLAGTATASTESLLIDKVEASLGPADRMARGSGSIRLSWGANPAIDAIVTARQVDLDKLIEAPDAAPRTPRDILAGLVRAVPGLAGGASWPVTIGLDINGVTLGGAQIIDLRGDLHSAAAGWTAERLSARLPGDSAVEASGRILVAPDLGFSGALALQSARPGVLMSWLDTLPTPAGTLDDPIRVATTMTAEPGRLILDKLEARTAAGEARGRIAFDVPALGRHALALDLTAETLDLDVIMRLARGAGARLDPATDTRLKLRANEATLAGLAARGLDMTLASDGRTFDAERISIADLAGFGLDLSGRLDGLGGPLSGNLAGRLTAGTVEGLVGLLARNDRTLPLSRAIAERAGVLGRTELSLLFQAGSGQTLRLRAAGKLGEANVHLEASGTGDLTQPLGLAGNLALVVEAPRADQVLTLLSGLAPASAAPATPTRLEFVLDRSPAGAAILRGEVESADTMLAFDGTQAPDGRRAATLRLTSRDLAPLLPLLGVPADLAGRVPAALTASIGGEGETWRFQTAGGSVNRTAVSADITGKARVVDGTVSVGALGLDTLASLLVGPAFLVETDAGGFADAPFGRAPFDGLDGRIALKVATLGLGTYPPLTGFETTISRVGSRTELTGLSARIAGATISGGLIADRSPLATLLSANLAAGGLPLALVLPGAQATASLDLVLTGTGTSPSALMASLRGEGRLAAPAAAARGFDGTALRRITREAERAQDRGRPIGDAAFAARLGEELDRSVDLPAIAAAVTLSGPLLRMAEIRLAVGEGSLGFSASADLAAGTLAATIRLAPPPLEPGDSLPLLNLRFAGALGRPDRTLDSDDVAGWLGLRLVERAGVAIGMTESDRFERIRQRLFSRFSAKPIPQVEVPLPPVIGLSPELLPPPPAPPVAPPAPEVVSEPEPPAEAQPAPALVAPADNAPVPVPRPGDQRPQPRPPQVATPPAGAPMDLPSVVRRALDQQGRPPAAVAPGAPMSILPPLPPAIEVGPAPGMRR